MAKRKTGKVGANCGRKYRMAVPPAVHTRMLGWGHTRRALRNLALEQRQLAWRMNRTTVRSGAQCEDLTELRGTYDWVRDFPAQAAQQTLRDLDRAFENWWNPEHPAGRPAREKRQGDAVRFSLPGQAVEVRHLNRKWSEVWVPKLGWMRFRRHRPISGEVRSATFTYTAGEWHVSFGVAAKERRAPANGKPSCGVDFGVACSAFVSTESEPRLMPPSLTDGERRRLVGLERRKARQLAYAKKHNKGRYSRRLRRTIAEIAKLRARQARRRLDFTHKLTHGLANSHGWVAIEDLRVKNMTRSAKGSVEEPGTNVRQKAGLNRGILDNIPGERRRQLAYKTGWYGSELRLVKPHGSSQECSECGVTDPANRPGCGRQFACVACGHQDHADRNAAITIERRGALQVAQTAGSAGARKAHNSTGRPPTQRSSRSRKAAGGSVKQPAHGLESRAA